MPEIFDFILLLLLIVGSIIWLLEFGFKSKQLEMRKIIGLLMLIAFFYNHAHVFHVPDKTSFQSAANTDPFVSENRSNAMF